MFSFLLITFGSGLIFGISFLSTSLALILLAGITIMQWVRASTGAAFKMTVIFHTILNLLMLIPIFVTGSARYALTGSA